ncbi:MULTISPECIES: aldo/keto reductase [unclassified Streptomyces]|uniref:aldo/keto reductase n=1 Tax=unclassified Streptomyces TaxID=2593676 RepID=UPI002E0F4FE3|nr:aldo/keto reductase [Streptomyces sp. NBC_01236]
MTQNIARPADASGIFRLGGDLPVHRLGYGAMQLTGPGVWGPPKDPEEAVRVLRRAVELGVDFIDTADSYGPFVSEQLIHKALHPYPAGLVIATKGGLSRSGPDDWRPLGRPEYLRQQTELSLRHLGLERIDLYQLHRIDPQVPLADQVGELRLLQQEGKIRHIGLSEVTVKQIEEARTIADIVSVQNLYNLANRNAEDVLDYAERENLGFIPWFPMATGQLARPGGPLDTLGKTYGASPSQLALAWLLHRSPVTLPIPGTSRVSHVEENTHAAQFTLSDTEFQALSQAV